MKDENTLVYVTLEKEKRAKKRWWDQYRQSCYNCIKKPAGLFYLIHCPVPEFYVGNKPWIEDRLRAVLEEVIQTAVPDDYLLSPAIRRALGMSGVDSDIPPVYVLKDMLRKYRRFQSITICLPEEGGTGAYEVITDLLTPYLPKVNALYMTGGDEWLFEELEDYFYFEYGIVAQLCKKPLKETFCIDLWSHNENQGYRDREGGVLSVAETLKFLDTMVKNGYNTES